MWMIDYGRIPPRCAALAVAAALMLCGCTERTSDNSSGQAEHLLVSVNESSKPEPGPEPSFSDEPEREAEQSYIEQVVQEYISKFERPGMSEFEKAKAAFDYIIEHTTLDDPIGLDIWRVRGNNGAQPSFVENRSLSVLLYQVGMCEDYAAALTMLLRGLGMEAEYVPGLTYAADGSGLVDHSWTVAKIDGVWYHIDCQLEQNVSRQGVIRYRYFMKSDGYFSGSHRWGQNLIDSGRLTPEQNAEIERGFLFEPCPQDYPLPPPLRYTAVPKPDMDALKAGVETELREYEARHGPLPQLELNTIPPVFALRGYPPEN